METRQKVTGSDELLLGAPSARGRSRQPEDPPEPIPAVNGLEGSHLAGTLPAPRWSPASRLRIYLIGVLKSLTQGADLVLSIHRP